MTYRLSLPPFPSQFCLTRNSKINKISNTHSKPPCVRATRVPALATVFFHLTFYAFAGNVWLTDRDTAKKPREGPTHEGFPRKRKKARCFE